MQLLSECFSVQGELTLVDAEPMDIHTGQAVQARAGREMNRMVDL